MTAKWLFIFREHTKQLWFRSSLYCILAVITALLGVVLNDAVPSALEVFIKPDAIRKILEILASSMLIVATFALSVMVEAYRAAATTATPRATQLLTENSSAQNALAAFIGAFLFSIVGLIAQSAGIYGTGGNAVLFAATIVVVILVVIMLLRWIEQLARLGRVEESIDLVEAATRQALVKRARVPFLGGCPLERIPDGAFPINSTAIGYVQYIDMEKLQRLAVHKGIHIYVDILPGSFCDLAHPIAYSNAPVDAATTARIGEALVIGDNRTFPQDPRFGFVVLAEIALRALSPSTNDPGTAIDVVGTSVRLFQHWARERGDAEEQAPIHYDRVWLAPLLEEDFFDDLFAPLSRAAAGHREVCIRLQKALRAISQLRFPPYVKPAQAWSREALEQCRRQLTEQEFTRVKGVADAFNQ